MNSSTVPNTVNWLLVLCISLIMWIHGSLKIMKIHKFKYFLQRISQIKLSSVLTGNEKLLICINIPLCRNVWMFAVSVLMLLIRYKSVKVNGTKSGTKSSTLRAAKLVFSCTIKITPQWFLWSSEMIMLNIPEIDSKIKKGSVCMFHKIAPTPYETSFANKPKN